ncbi:MAG: 16S rRNA (cytosine(967)-C(5))-methyltransferase RsmB [Candidatus Zixiibacteriota bacterium]
MGPISKKKSSNFDSVRAACIQALGLVFDRGWKSDDAVKAVISGQQYNDLDRRFLMQLCHGVIKMRRRLDFTYSFYLKKPNIKIDKVTRNIMRLGLYQLMFTNRIPAGAAVSESVNLARGLVHESRGSFVNAILRNYLRTPERVVFPDKNEFPVEYLGEYYSYPDWFVEYCINEFGFEKAETLLARGNDSPHLTYRINRLRYNPEQLTELLKTHYIEYSQGKYLEDYYHIFRQGIPLEQELLDGGRVYIQDESAGMAVRLLNPKQKDNILDLCSAPGGKATYAAALMHNQGRITSVDISQDRLKTVVENAQRLGITCIAPVVCDTLDFRGPASNRVLLDVPCSGWGVQGKHSDLRWMKDRSDSQKLAEIQAKLIRHAADLVTPGGVLVYSTCTIIRDENDSIVEEFLLERPDFSVDTPTNTFPEELFNERGFIKTYPNVDYLDGAFCVRLKKKLGSKSKKL